MPGHYNLYRSLLYTQPEVHSSTLSQPPSHRLETLINVKCPSNESTEMVNQP